MVSVLNLQFRISNWTDLQCSAPARSSRDMSDPGGLHPGQPSIDSQTLSTTIRAAIGHPLVKPKTRLNCRAAIIPTKYKPLTLACIASSRSGDPSSVFSRSFSAPDRNASFRTSTSYPVARITWSTSNSLPLLRRTWIPSALRLALSRAVASKISTLPF